jgi:metal-responsive CopG/Arc/MetJ family transcriptional regulator
MRNKLPENKKRVNANITIDKDLNLILEEYLEENNISNKSKYIENLIREDFEKKGKNIEREF